MIKEIFKLASLGKYKDAAKLIRSLIDNKEDISGAGVNFAHILLLAADWNYIEALLPKNTNTFSRSGHLLSVSTMRPMNGEGKPIPWFTYPAIDFLDRIALPGWQVFEWGSGNSTLWWASKTESVIAVEDNESWHDEIKRQLPQNATILKRSDEAYFKAICDYPKEHFDAVIVDGSTRNECAVRAIPHLKPNGILIFDNSDSREYAESTETMKENGFYRIDFWGLIPSYLYKNCTSMYFKDPAFLREYQAPCQHNSSIGVSCFQAMEALKQM
tara:strand:- start:325 stop:1140 length:816 start_codon:yes stop_codon:yes gene_type:complete